MTPTRIQRRRKVGWSAPLDSEGRKPVYVGRPGRFGNPFTPDLYVKSGRIGYLDHAEGRRMAADDFEQWLIAGDDGLWCGPGDESVAARRALLGAVSQLAGRNLMCWCPLPEPGQPDYCHAAVLLRLANSAGAVRP
ncbi:DUF4326 domain-containing protein [Streptomyces formicae]